MAINFIFYTCFIKKGPEHTEIFRCYIYLHTLLFLYHTIKTTGRFILVAIILRYGRAIMFYRPTNRLDRLRKRFLFWNKRFFFSVICSWLLHPSFSRQPNYPHFLVQILFVVHQLRKWFSSCVFHTFLCIHRILSFTLKCVSWEQGWSLKKNLR